MALELKAGIIIASITTLICIFFMYLFIREKKLLYIVICLWTPLMWINVAFYNNPGALDTISKFQFALMVATAFCFFQKPRKKEEQGIEDIIDPHFGDDPADLEDNDMPTPITEDAVLPSAAVDNEQSNSDDNE